MAQENGWPFKLVYLEWAETAKGEKIPLGNGLPRPFVELLKKEFKLETYRHYGMPPGLPSKYDLEGCPWAHSATSLPRIAQKYSLQTGEVLEVSVDEVKDDGIYLLPVDITGGVGLNVLNEKQHIAINGEPYSYNFLKDSILTYPKILHLLQTGKVKFLFNNLHDPNNKGAVECLKRLEDTLHINYHIPYDNIIFLSGSKIDPLSSSLKCHVFNDEGLYYAEYMGNQIIGSEADNFYPGNLYKSEVFSEKDLNDSVIRPLKFLSPNNHVTRLNRIMFLHWVIKHNLLNLGLFSFLDKTLDRQWIKDSLSAHYEITENELADMENLLPHEGLDTKKYQKKDFQTIVHGPGQVKSWYEQTYLSVVTETSSYTEMPFISEKSYRPMAHLHPFIILGPSGILKSLRKLGFKTFAGFIDESYDDIEDDVERFKSIEKEIIRFKNMTQQEIHEWYYSLTDILIYNKNHLRSLAGTDPFKPVFKQIYDTYVSR